jgi:polyphosphate kinase 2 (PPK2 family)
MLETVDLSKKLSRKQYDAQIPRYQVKLREQTYQLYLDRRLLIAVYEGWDAAGKGGSIRRITELLDPRGFEVHSIAAPEGDDKQHHYLWRFWRRLLPPREKQVMIFDRSWYGRVLVERVEGFAAEEEWKRAYREINDFERQLADAGAILVKFWIHISPEEQLRRFEERQDSVYKSWKLTGEDWRNRSRWDTYREAADEMLLKTSTPVAPWTIIEGNDKYYARVKALRTLVRVLGKALNGPPHGRGKPRKKKGR